MDKTSAYNEIQQTLQEIFLNNLTFFKQSHPLLYDKIIKFEKLNIENYSIELKDNTFQLVDIQKGINFYQNEPFSDASNRLNNFDISSAFNLIKIEPLKKSNHYENEINAYEYLNNFIEHFNSIEIKINKFIFLGTLLGIHINDFHKFLNAKVYLIIEPNIEIFRLSMFMTDYRILSNDSKLFFAINEDEDNLKKILKEFLNYRYEFNNLIHFELAHKIHEPLINQLSMIFTHQGEMRYPFSDYLISLKRFHNYFIQNKNYLLNLSNIYDFLETYPILFLGAGPSLEKNLNFVHLNRNKFIIVAIAATLKSLESKDIIPDIILTIDGQEIVKEQFNIKKSLYQNSIILSSIKLDYKVHQLLKNNKIFFFQNSLNLFKDLGFVAGVTVGDVGIELLLTLGVKKLYLLGIDAAIDSKTGMTHIATHSNSRKINFEKNDDQIDFNKTIIYVKGNFDKKVPTLMEYKEMIEEINEKFKHLNDSFRIYNLSNGAYFRNTIPLKTNQINIKETIEKDIFKDIFFINLNNISKKNINRVFKKELEKEKEILSKLNSLKKDINFFEQFKSIQYKYPYSVSINILEKYFKLILPYYNFLQNKTLANNILEIEIKRILKDLFIIFP